MCTASVPEHNMLRGGAGGGPARGGRRESARLRGAEMGGGQRLGGQRRWGQVLRGRRQRGFAREMRRGPRPRQGRQTTEGSVTATGRGGLSSGGEGRRAGRRSGGGAGRGGGGRSGRRWRGRQRVLSPDRAPEGATAEQHRLPTTTGKHWRDCGGGRQDELHLTRARVRDEYEMWSAVSGRPSCTR